MSARIARGEVVTFSRRDELPPEAETDRASFAAYGTCSHAAIPLAEEGTTRRVLALSTVREERQWPEALVERLRLIAEVLVGILARKHAELEVGAESGSAPCSRRCQPDGRAGSRWPDPRREPSVARARRANDASPVASLDRHQLPRRRQSVWRASLAPGRAGGRRRHACGRARDGRGRVREQAAVLRSLVPLVGDGAARQPGRRGGRVHRRHGPRAGAGAAPAVQRAPDCGAGGGAAAHRPGAARRPQSTSRTAGARDLPAGAPGREGPIGARRIAERVGEIANDVHRLAYRLHPFKLDYLGLTSAARGFCQEIAAAHHITVTFTEHDVPDGLPREVSLCVYRVLQEALSNVVRHSGSPRAEVALYGDGAGLRLTVRDFGLGMAGSRGRDHRRPGARQHA